MNNSRLSGLIMPSLFFGLGLWLIFTCGASAEFDGIMQFNSAREFLRGEGYVGWASHFWPPLFGLLMALGEHIADPLLIGKVISLVSASTLLLVTYRFVYKYSSSVILGWVGQLLLITNSVFFLSALESENHTLDSLFYVAVILLVLSLFIENKKGPGPARKSMGRSILLIGFLAGLGGLTRYTSYALLPPMVLALLFVRGPFKKKLKSLTAVFSVFALLNLFWWVSNFKLNGSPLHTWQYLNIGSRVYPGGELVWWWQDQKNYFGLSSILQDFPQEYWLNFVSNLQKIFAILWDSLRSVIGFWILSLLMVGMFKKKWALNLRERLIKLLSSGVLWVGLAFLGVYVILVSQAFVFNEVLLSWIVLFLVGIALLFQKFFEMRIYRRLVFPVLVVLAFYQIAQNVAKYRSHLFEQAHFAQVGELLKSDPAIEGKVIMSVNAAYAHYAGSKFLMMPLYYPTLDVKGMIAYLGVLPKVLSYAPKLPVDLDFTQKRADYFIVDEDSRKFFPEVDRLCEELAQTGFLEAVYKVPRATVYKINGPQ